MKRNSVSQSAFLRPRLLLGLGFCLIAGLLATLAIGQNFLGQRQSGSSRSSSHQIVVEPHKATGPIYSEKPKVTEEQLKAREEELNEVNPLPPLGGENKNSLPAVAPTEKAKTVEPSTTDTSSGTLPLAPNDFIYRAVHDLTTIEASSSRSLVDEPSVANMGDTVFYTGNWYAARSTNGGQSFTYVDPSTTFPSVNNGFCCDQVANYAPNQDMIIWALQYIKDSNSGTLRVARAVGSAAVSSNSWIYYDFNPQQFGFPNGNWFDFPNMTVSDNYLYLTSNVFTTAGDSFSGSAIWRIPLSQLAAGGSISSDYFARTDVATLRCTDGAHTTMYWGTLLSTNAVRIFHWDDFAGTVFWDDVGISSFAYLNRDGVAIGPDGSNWAARADSRIVGSWVANGVIGLMWSAKQGGSFPYPYTIVARFNQSTRSLINQTAIWHSQYAWLYPAASVNAAGNLAGLVTAGGSTGYPTTNIWISDDVENGFSPLALHGATASNAGPSSNIWGDYQTVRTHKSSPNTWVASTHYLKDSGSNVVPRYLWFGRERDFPASSPSAPVASAATAITTNGFTANWTAVSGANGYRMDVSTNSSFATFVSGYQDIDVGNVTSQAVGGLNPSSTFFFRVRAYNSGGTSGNSNVITVTTASAATLTVNANPANGGIVTGSGTYPVGSSQQISATANSGWAFSGWNDGNSQSTRSVTVPAGGITYTANFAQNTAALTVVANPSNGGTVTGGGTYPVGSSQQISATAKSGFTFTGWNDGDTETPRTVIVPAGGITYTANFSTIATTATITVLANPSNGGTVTGGGTYPVGSSQQISGTAKSGFTFVKWNDGITLNPRTVTVPAGGVTYTANFSLTQTNATITLIASPSNGGTVSGAGTFAIGSSRQISATPNSGFTFSGWDDGNTQNPRTIVVPTGGATYTANFSSVGVANDSFALAQVLTGNSGTVTGSNVGATKEAGEPNHAGDAGGHSIWYKWTAPATGTATFDTLGSNFDTLLAVYIGSSVNALTAIASNDDTPTTTQSQVTFAATAGITYLIAVDGFGGATGAVTLTRALTTSQSVVATPRISPGSGSFKKKVSVSITCATTSATIYYTTNGTDPTTSSNRYTRSITLSGRGSKVVKAKAVKTGYTDSAIATATLTIR